jgi:hypothetical protein
MVAMPYILVVIVLDMLSIPFFSLTTTALLYRLPLVKEYLPGSLSARAWASFVVIALVLTSLALAVRLLVGTTVFQVLAYIGFANSLVLVYRFLSKRYFLHRPKVLRRLLNALLSAVITAAAFIMVEAIVVVLFVIR